MIYSANDIIRVMAEKGIFGLGLFTGKWLPLAFEGAVSNIVTKTVESATDRFIERTKSIGDKFTDNLTNGFLRSR